VTQPTGFAASNAPMASPPRPAYFVFGLASIGLLSNVVLNGLRFTHSVHRLQRDHPAWSHSHAVHLAVGGVLLGAVFHLASVLASVFVLRGSRWAWRALVGLALLNIIATAAHANVDPVASVFEVGPVLLLVLLFAPSLRQYVRRVPQQRSTM
jgi:hypothetical protein